MLSREDTPRPPGGALDSLLAGRPVTRVEWGLDRIRAILDGLGRPQEAFAAVHVGGTNGKGSTAVAAAAILRAAGLRTGLYTSPHLLDVRERILLEGRPAPEALLASCVSRIRPLADREGATHFEAVTATAFLAFAEAGVEWASVETGVGGRLDATNVLVPSVVALTGVARDHEEWLGRDPAAIAGEKAGILKRGIPAVVGPVSPPVWEVFEARAAERGAPLLRLGREATIADVRTGLDGTSFVYRSAARPRGLELRTPLVGTHQARNAALAVLALEQVGAAPDDDEVRRGLAGIRLPGRFQVLREADLLWVLDVAHNPAAIEALLQTVRRVELPEPVVALVAILEDKPWRDMLRRLVAATSRLVLSVAPSSPASRRWDAEAAGAVAARAGAGVEVEPDYDRALARARELAAGGTVLVTGSTHTVGDALRRLDARAEGAPHLDPSEGEGRDEGRGPDT